jgi:hypothetical protein
MTIVNRLSKASEKSGGLFFYHCEEMSPPKRPNCVTHDILEGIIKLHRRICKCKEEMSGILVCRVFG